MEKQERTDQELVCQECGKSFTWSIGEQEFFFDKGFTPPKRCPACRLARRQGIKQRKEERAEEGES